MDRVFSVRLDEKLVRAINRLVENKSVSKKAVIEKALRIYLDRCGDQTERETINRTSGAWRRRGTTEDTWREIRGTFNRSMTRHCVEDGTK